MSDGRRRRCYHPSINAISSTPHRRTDGKRTHFCNDDRYIDEGGSRITGLGQVEEEGIELAVRFGEALALLLGVCIV